MQFTLNCCTLLRLCGIYSSLVRTNTFPDHVVFDGREDCTIFGYSIRRSLAHPTALRQNEYSNLTVAQGSCWADCVIITPVRAL